MRDDSAALERVLCALRRLGYAVKIGVVPQCAFEVGRRIISCL